MKNFKHIIFAIAILAIILTTNACQQPGGNQTGSEFVPDMAHSIAYEANVNSEYSFNSFEEVSVKSRKELSEPRLPVAGTIPRGYTGVGSSGQNFNSPEEAVRYTKKVMTQNDGMTPNGFVPYYFENSDTGRAQATAQLIYNPFPITKNGLERGKELYNVYCGICHGEKGDGLGYLVSDENTSAAYPAAPKNFLLDEYIAASNGRFYHSIMYGLNVMGSYADKLSYEERWQVIHWIRALQAKEKKAKYSESANTLNSSFGVPIEKANLAAQLTPPTPIGGSNEDTPQGGNEAESGETGHSHDDDSGHSHESGH